MTSFWSWWIIILTVISYALIFWVLLANRKIDNKAPDATTGHAADGIEEYDNPLPAWWFSMFLITLIYGIGYLVVYPGLGNYKGLLNWTQVGQWQAKVDSAEKKFSAQRLAFLAMPAEEVARSQPALKMGQRMFSNNCAQCHGADAKGSYGFPNLTDGDWLYGGDPSSIKTSITYGRMAAMPAWGPMLGDDGVRNVTAYVMRMSGRDVDDIHADAGKAQYDMVCAACHMADGSGNPAFGAPNLSNGIWLYGGEAEDIAHTIRMGRSGVMPAHEELLSEAKIHIIAAYVYSLNQ